jgi:hypothetical protein
MQMGQTDLGAPETGPSAVGSVDPSTGAFGTSIPFALPTARGSVQPTLSLDYSSSGPRGEGGIGWSLSLPSIERHNSSGAPQYTNDPAQGARINPQTQDLFTFAGQALVPICFLPSDFPQCASNKRSPNQEKMPTWAGPGWHYYRLETETGSLLRFFWSPNHQTWVVQKPDGSTMEFGVPQDDPSDVGGTDTDPVGTAALAAAAVWPNPALPATFRFNLVRQYDAQRIPGTTHPANLIKYKWAKLAQPGTNQPLPDDAGSGTDPAFRTSLTDIYDTPKVGDSAPSPGSFAHHVHLNYVDDPTWMVPNSSPVWKARPVMRLTGVDVTSQTFAGAATREQVRRYVLSYIYDWNEYELHQVQLDGWCSSGDPVEDPTTSLLPPEPANPVCGVPGASGTTWPPPTTFSYYSGGGATVPAPPFPTFYKMPNVDVGGYAAGAVTLPTLLDLNADGMPDIVNPPANSSGLQTVELNSVNTPLNSWTALPISLLHPTLGVTSNTISPWSSSYAGGAFLNDSHVNTTWFDPAWFASQTASKLTSPGVSYVTYSPVFSSPSSMDWGAPVEQTLASVFPGCLQNCVKEEGCASQDCGTICAQGSRYAGCDQKLATLDVDGDGLQDLVVASAYGVGADPHHVFDQSTESYSTSLNVKFTQRGINGTVAPFAAPGPQETTSWNYYSGDPVQVNDQPNFCVESVTDAAHFLTALPWTMGDINGDGLPDFIALVHTNSPVTNEIQVYFGHGDGVFGQCDPGPHLSNVSSDSVACLCGAAKNALGISTTWSPINSQNAKLNAQFHDVDGDGLADAIVPSSDGFDVYINMAGNAFPGPSIHVSAAAALGWTDTSSTSSWQSRVYLFADMNGSGVDDVVIADTAGNIGYVDVLGGARPGLIHSITATSGATTTVQYQDLPSLSRAATATGYPWLTQSAESRYIVTQIALSDETPGVTSPPIVTTYTYRDPMYDARDREFVGFTSVEAVTAGDATSPSMHVKTTFYQSFCDSSYVGKSCSQTADYPSRSLRGLPILTDTFGDQSANSDGSVGGAVLSTVHRGFSEQTLYSGLDGRNVHRVWAGVTDTYWYDNTSTVYRSISTSLVDVTVDGTASTQLTFVTNNAALRTETSYAPDPWGMDSVSDDLGRVDASGNSMDGRIRTISQSLPAPLDTVDYWIWRAQSVTDEGLDANFNVSGVPRSASYTYDSRGNVLLVQAQLVGTIPMMRATVVSGAGEGGAPPSTLAPPGASADGQPFQGLCHVGPSDPLPTLWDPSVVESRRVLSIVSDFVH